MSTACSMHGLRTNKHVALLAKWHKVVVFPSSLVPSLYVLVFGKKTFLVVSCFGCFCVCVKVYIPHWAYHLGNVSVHGAPCSQRNILD